MAGRPTIPLSLALALALSCFSESPTAGEDGTTGEPCPPQTLGCPCEAGACAAGLSCEPSIELCIDPSCTPGTELCTCADGDACLQGLQCEGGLCRPPPPPPGADTSAGAVTSGPTATSSPGDGVSTLPGEADVTTVADTLDPITTSITVTDDGDPTQPSCAMMPCAECYACETAPGGMCSAVWAPCGGNEECANLAGCVFGCVEGDAECVQSCCAASRLSGNLTYNTVATCLENACTSCGQDLNCGV